jgi:hypothetical protein
LLFEARDELARTEDQLGVFGLAAGELDAVDAADEVDQQLVAVLGLQALARARLVGAGLLGQLVQRSSTSSSPIL